MERHAERRRLLLVRHGRLDRLGAADDRDPVPRSEQVVERVLLEVAARSGPGTSDARTCSSSIAIGSPSASRSRLTTTTGSDGETCRMRPRRAPAASRAESSVRLPGVRPRARMSSLNEVMSMPFATFGSATNVPLRAAARGSPRARARRARRARSGATRRGRRRAGARTGSRRRRSSGSISSSTCSRVSRCFVTRRDAGAARRGRRRRGARRLSGSKKWKRAGSTASSSRVADRERRPRIDPRREQRALGRRAEPLVRRRLPAPRR